MTFENSKDEMIYHFIKKQATKAEPIEASLDKDIFDWFLFGAPVDGEWLNRKSQYFRAIMNADGASSPIHSMLLYTTYVAYVQGMVQAHKAHHPVITDTNLPTPPEPSVTDYFQAFAELLKVYGQLFPDKLNLEASCAAEIKST